MQTITYPVPIKVPDGWRYRLNADGTVVFRQAEKRDSYLYEGQAIAVWGSDRRSNHHYFIIERIPEPRKIKSQFFRSGLWIARDADGVVGLYIEEPQKDYSIMWGKGYSIMWGSGRRWMNITAYAREHHPEVFKGPWYEAKFRVRNGDAT